MGIKLVRNFEEGDWSVINEEVLLQTTDDNRMLRQFNGKRYFIFNPSTNQRFEVMPEIAKYNMTKVYYGSCMRDYIIFTTARQINEKEIEITYVWYSIVNGESKNIYSDVVLADELSSKVFLKAFMLNDDYCIFEKITGKDNDSIFELYLKNINDNKGIVVENTRLITSGIESMVALEGNKCCIKLGDELVGIVNANRFVSDLIINLEDICIEVIDSVSEHFRIPYVNMINEYIVYSKVDEHNDTKEVVFYDYINKVKKVRLNNSEGFLDFENIYMIAGIPYYLDKNGGKDKLINLDTQKTEYEFDDKTEFICAFDDLIVISKTSKRIFTRNSIEVYRNTDFENTIYKIKGIYKDVVIHFDDLLVFWD